MKKVGFLCLSFFMLGTVCACDMLESEPTEQPVIDETPNKDGFSSISKDGLTIKTLPNLLKNVSYDNVRKEFLITNSTDEAEYWASGSSETRIRFAPACTESCVLILNGCTITTNTGSSPVLWESDKNKLELKAQMGSENTLTSYADEVPAVESMNNLDIGGGGTLNMNSNNSSCIKCDKLTFKGTGTFNIKSNGKHGVKCKSLAGKEKTTYVANIEAAKCGVLADGKVEKEKGYVNIVSGSIRVKSYGEFGISCTSYLNLGDANNYGFLAITTSNESTALDVKGTKTKDPNGSSYKVNGVEKSF